MNRKQRLSASVDADLLDAVENAVADGRSANVSSWVSDALRLKLEHDRKLDALGDFIRSYESEHGVITADEMRAATRRAHSRAVSVRTSAPLRRVAGSGRK